MIPILALQHHCPGTAVVIHVIHVILIWLQVYWNSTCFWEEDRHQLVLSFFVATWYIHHPHLGIFGKLVLLHGAGHAKYGLGDLLMVAIALDFRMQRFSPLRPWQLLVLSIELLSWAQKNCLPAGHVTILQFHCLCSWEIEIQTSTVQDVTVMKTDSQSLTFLHQGSHCVLKTSCDKLAKGMNGRRRVYPVSSKKNAWNQWHFEPKLPQLPGFKRLALQRYLGHPAHAYELAGLVFPMCGYWCLLFKNWTYLDCRDIEANV